MVDVGRMGFGGDEYHIYNNYFLSLRSSHVRIKEEEDLFIWSKNLVGRRYTPKLGYKVLGEDTMLHIEKWWFK